MALMARLLRSKRIPWPVQLGGMGDGAGGGVIGRAIDGVGWGLRMLAAWLWSKVSMRTAPLAAYANLHTSHPPIPPASPHIPFPPSLSHPQNCPHLQVEPMTNQPVVSPESSAIRC